MKVEIIKPPPSEDLVTITMTRSEAEILKALVGGIGHDPRSKLPAHELLFNLWCELDTCGLEYVGATFSDYFEGRAVAK